MKSDGKGVFIIVLILSALFLFIGNRSVAGDIPVHDDMGGWYNYSGVVVEITERVETFYGLGNVDINIEFDVRLTNGELRGETVSARQHISDFFLVNEREVSVGDRVLIAHDAWNDIFHFFGYQRINFVVILGAVFLVAVLFFGRRKGFNAIVALGFTCMAVFWVFVPAILAGRNIYLTTIIVCVFAIVSTLLIVIGANKKALSAVLGCLGGVLLSGLLMWVMDILLRLTGAVDRDTEMLVMLENPVDLRALIFAGVILGAVGAIMDVAMSISSSLWEVKEAGGVSSFEGLLKSGINIGKDILGTMLNTLILAYIGSSLTLILFVTAYNPSFLVLFNRELIIVEFLRALVGSFGMLLTIPLTAGICGWLYAKPPENIDYGEFDDYFKPSAGRKARGSSQRENMP